MVEDIDQRIYALARRYNGVYLMNPGSAAQPRDGMPPSYAYIDYEKGGIFISHVSL